MPVMMKSSRSAASPLRSCRSVSSAKSTWGSRWFSLVAAKYVLSQSRLQTVLPPGAIGLPQVSGDADKRLQVSNGAKSCGRTSLWRSPVTALCVALFIGMSYAVAGAQTATTTTLTVNPLNPPSMANGSVFVMTATVKGTSALTAGTVTFRDTFGSVTSVLGTVQVQSAHGTAGNAVLMRQLGGIGTHSIVATFNPPNNFLTSFSAAQGVTTTGLYPTTGSLAQTGGVAGSWQLTATIVGIGSLNLSPTGSVSLQDISNANVQVGLAGTLGAGAFGQQTVAGGGSPIAVGNNPQDIVAGDFQRRRHY